MYTRVWSWWGRWSRPLRWRSGPSAWLESACSSTSPWPSARALTGRGGSSPAAYRKVGCVGCVGQQGTNRERTVVHTTAHVHTPHMYIHRTCMIECMYYTHKLYITRQSKCKGVMYVPLKWLRWEDPHSLHPLHTAAQWRQSYHTCQRSLSQPTSDLNHEEVGSID